MLPDHRLAALVVQVPAGSEGLAQRGDQRLLALGGPAGRDPRLDVDDAPRAARPAPVLRRHDRHVRIARVHQRDRADLRLAEALLEQHPLAGLVAVAVQVDERPGLDARRSRGSGDRSYEARRRQRDRLRVRPPQVQAEVVIADVIVCRDVQLHRRLVRGEEQSA
jgi:hypothetical protein